MAKSNGRTQRPQRTSRNSAKTKVEATDAVEDNLDEAVASAEQSSTDKQGTESKSEGAEETRTEDVAGEDAADEDSTESAEDESAADDEESDESEDTSAAKTTAKKTSTTDGDSTKSGSAKSASGKSTKKASTAKRTSRSGNPAKRAQGRKTASYTSQSGQQTIKPNPRWFLPVLIALLLVGLAWLVTFYITQGAFPVEAWANWNILIGFGFFVAGLIMSTRWR